MIRRSNHRLFTRHCPIVEDNIQEHIESHNLHMALKLYEQHFLRQS